MAYLWIEINNTDIRDVIPDIPFLRILTIPFRLLFIIIFIFWPIIILAFYILSQKKKKLTPQTRFVISGVIIQVFWVVYLLYQVSQTSWLWL